MGSAWRGAYMDFLCGCTLHEIVCPSSTLTQRTMYDCGALAGCAAAGGGADCTLLCISSCSMPAIAGRLRTAGLGGGWWGVQSSIRAGALTGGGGGG